jgi:alkylhydroperoxidase family enzyme
MAASLTHCEYCIDMGSAISRQWGLTDQEVLALPSYQTSPQFSEAGQARPRPRRRHEPHPVDVPAGWSAGFASISTTAS